MFGRKFLNTKNNFRKASELLGFVILFYSCGVSAQKHVTIKSEFGKPMINKDSNLVINLSITNDYNFPINIPKANTFLEDKKEYSEYYVGYELKSSKSKKTEHCLFLVNDGPFRVLQRLEPGETKIISTFLPGTCLSKNKKYKISLFLKVLLKEKGKENELIEMQSAPLNFQLD
jgi:hypothetical protein